MSGWDRIEGHWWPSIADALPRPWPREAVLMDLRWWDGQERINCATGGRSGGRRPGRPALCQRWGWTDRTARNLMAAVEEWRDPHHADLRPDDGGPTEVQRRSRKRTASD